MAYVAYVEGEEVVAAVSGHVQAPIPSRDHVLVFGGYDQSVRLNQCAILSSSSAVEEGAARWNGGTLSGDVEGRAGAASAVVEVNGEERVLVMGGYDSLRNVLDDSFLLHATEEPSGGASSTSDGGEDGSSFVVGVQQCGGHPELHRRWFGAAVVGAGQQVFAHGGWNERGPVGEAHIARVVDIVEAPKRARHVRRRVAGPWKRCAAQGEAPTARRWHSVAAVDVNQVCVFGGYDGDNSMLGDGVYMFDAARDAWSRHLPGGPQPEARARHTATVVGKQMLVVGGYGADGGRSVSRNNAYRLLLDEMRWEQLDPGAVFEMAKRSGHGACMLGEHVLGVYGGGVGSGQAESSLVVLDLRGI